MEHTGLAHYQNIKSFRVPALLTVNFSVRRHSDAGVLQLFGFIECKLCSIDIRQGFEKICATSSLLESNNLPHD